MAASVAMKWCKLTPDGEQNPDSGADIDRRAHAGMPGGACGLEHTRGGRDHGGGSGDGALRGAGAFAERQRAGVHRVCDPGLAQREEGEDDLHHTGFAVGERIYRELPRQTEGRMFEP